MEDETNKPRWSCSLKKTVGSVVVEVDSKNIHQHIKKIGQEQGNLINFGDVVIHAIAKTLKEFPELNSNFDTETRLKSEINLGFLINIDKGSKMAVVKNADKKSLIELSNEIKNLALRYLREELADYDPNDYSIIVSNLSSLNAKFTIVPVLDHQSTTVSIASEFEHLKLIDGVVTTVKLFNISLSFDYRVSNCQRALQFLNTVKKRIENLDN